MFAKLQRLIHQLTDTVDQAPLSPDRLAYLNPIKEAVRAKIATHEAVRMIFICTHNSRRSHLSQVWAQVAAVHYAIPQVTTFSGGTEETAFNLSAVNALRDQGFSITRVSDDANPRFRISFNPNTQAMTAFSKRFDAEQNPSHNFFAIMTCTEADAGCPIVPGAEARFSLPYRDPKEADGSPREPQTYRERADQIAREMLFLFEHMR